MSDEKKLALLIDSDNVSAKYAQFIIQEASKHGELIIKRIYGDWEKNNTGWRIPAMNNSIMPVQQNSYIAGKNATDFSMIIDAMDILYTYNVDGFVLVTSDSDFTRLAIRLREAGKLVIGIGEVKTPLAFTSSCHEFSYLNRICANVGDEYDEQTLRRAVLDFVRENDDGRLDLMKIDSYLTSRYGNIDYAALGYNRLSMFISSFPELRRISNYVSLRKGAAKPKPAAVESTLSEKDITHVIVEYLQRQSGKRDDISRVAEHVTRSFGKIDFSQFGSKKFAKFIDRQSALIRINNTVALKAAESAPEKPAAELVEKISGKPIEEIVEKIAKRQPKPLDETDERIARKQIKPLDETDERIARKQIKPLDETDERIAKKQIKPLDETDEKIAKRQPKPLDETDERIARKQPKPLDETDERIARKQPKPFETPAAHVRTMHINSQIFAMEVQKYANENMPNGGNLGQLNNMLLEKYGKNYIAELNFPDFATALATVSGVTAKKNLLYVLENAKQSEKRSKKPVESEKTEIADNEKRSEITADTENHGESSRAAEKSDNTKKRGKKAKGETPAEKTKQPEPIPEPITEPAEPEEQPPQKPDINTVIREVHAFAVQNENNGALAALGSYFMKKYGRGYLKELGYPTMKKLVASVIGVSIKNNVVVIDEDFLERTERIEQFVNDFARGEGSHSIKALSTQMKKEFEGFDFAEYGYARFSDFINAIDGVHADRYHVVAED